MINPTMPQRRPLLAALASLVLPGFGQLYNGDLNRAIWLFLTFALLCIPGMALVALYLPDQWMLPTLLLGLASTLGVWGYAVVQAWRSARRQAPSPARAWQISLKKAVPPTKVWCNPAVARLCTDLAHSPHG